MSCTRFFSGCAQMLAPPHCLHVRLQVVYGCACRCSPRRIASTGFFGGCARRCSSCRIACSLALPSSSVVLADARPATWLAPAFFAVVRALCAPLLHSVSSCPRPAHFLPTLRFSCRTGSLGQRTLSLLHSRLFPIAFKPFQLAFGLLHLRVFELLASRPTSPRGPSPAVSLRPVSHASRQLRFLPTFPLLQLPCPTLSSSPVDQAPALAGCSL